MTRNRQNFFITFIILLIILIAGCGVKGPPVVPGYYEPPTVRNLAYQVTGDKLVLSWKLPKDDGAQENKIASAGVYRLKQPMGKQDCPNCPRIFERVANLAVRSVTMTYTDSIMPGFQYYYKIVLSDDADRSGGDSNIVHHIHEGNSQ